MAKQYIKIRGAAEHNLKHVDINIPRNELVVLTGLSGSGKSSLAFDTIYAEGQRRYMESLSSYARQFLGQMEKPEVESIEGLSPAISIDQKSTNRNPRSTVGTVTEIYDYLRLLYARIGIPHCPNCGREVQRQTIDQMVDQLLALPEKTRVQILAPVVRGKKGRHEKVLEKAKRSGYVRVRVDGNQYELSEEIALDKNIKHNIEIVVDRISIRGGIQQRLTDSLEAALALADSLAEAESSLTGEETNRIKLIEQYGKELVEEAAIRNAVMEYVESKIKVTEQEVPYETQMDIGKDAGNSTKETSASTTEAASTETETKKN